MAAEYPMRVNRFLRECGVCSRREADRIIGDSRVTVKRGEEIFTAGPGEMIADTDLVLLDGERIRRKENKSYYLYHKAVGEVCTAKEADRKSIFRNPDIPAGLTYVGRLDKDSSGLLLLTDDGDLNRRLSMARFHQEKEYLCTVSRPVKEEDLQRLRDGVPVLDTITRPCTVTRTGECSFSIILTQGLNRQIRRMCEYCGYRVTELIRVRIGPLLLGDLKKGSLRPLTEAELKALGVSDEAK